VRRLADNVLARLAALVPGGRRAEVGLSEARFDPTPNVYRLLRSLSAPDAETHLAARLDADETRAAMRLHKIAQQSDLTEFMNLVRRLDRDTLAHLPVELPAANPQFFSDAAQAAARLKTLLQGKSVVLTGPAEHGAASRSAALVESFDVVVRLNFQWPIPEALRPHLGTRCDVLVHCCNGDYPVESLRTPDLKTLRMVLMEQGLHSRRLKRLCDEASVPTQYISFVYAALTRAIGAPPTTGLVAVAHLLRQPLKKLHLLGLTFGRTPYYAGYKSRAAAGSPWQHESEAEVRWLQSRLAEDPRLSVDPIAARELSRAK
jgi:hypothetical protein